MSITDQIDHIIQARWNPYEEFTIQDIAAISEQANITRARSTIQRTMQEVRDRGTILFTSSGHGRGGGHYMRRPVGAEKEGDNQSIAKQAARSIAGEFSSHPLAKKLAGERAMRLLKKDGDNPSLVQDIQQIETSIRDATERWSMVQTRLGQGEFRRKLIAYWRQCAVTGCTLTPALRASHIKPWRHCTDDERLDVYNGLLLLPNIDVLFDLGLITIDQDGAVRQSVLLRNYDGDHFGIPGDAVAPLNHRHQSYLDYPRPTVYLG